MSGNDGRRDRRQGDSRENATVPTPISRSGARTLSWALGAERHVGVRVSDVGLDTQRDRPGSMPKPAHSRERQDAHRTRFAEKQRESMKVDEWQKPSSEGISCPFRRSREPPDLPSHGRGHRFDPSSAHGAKSLRRRGGSGDLRGCPTGYRRGACSDFLRMCPASSTSAVAIVASMSGT